MNDDDNAYFRRRAAAERELAETSFHPKVAQAHSELARRYLSLIAQGAKDQGRGI